MHLTEARLVYVPMPMLMPVLMPVPMLMHHQLRSSPVGATIAIAVGATIAGVLVVGVVV